MIKRLVIAGLLLGVASCGGFHHRLQELRPHAGCMVLSWFPTRLTEANPTKLIVSTNQASVATKGHIRDASPFSGGRNIVAVKPLQSRQPRVRY